MLPSSPFYSGHDGTQSKVLVSNSEAKFWFTLTMGKLTWWDNNLLIKNIRAENLTITRKHTTTSTPQLPLLREDLSVSITFLF